MTKGFVIREFQDGDEEGVKKVHCQAVRLLSDFYDYRQINAWAPWEESSESFRKTLDETISYVAVGEGEIAGFADMIYDASYIWRLYVHPGYQGEGMGSKLINSLESKVNPDTNYIELDAAIPSIGFYINKGYDISRLSKVQVNGTNLEVMNMYKLL